MANEYLWLLLFIIDFGFAILAIYLFGKLGLYITIVTSIIMCNLQVLKVVDMFGLTVALGNIAYASIFLATDLLAECFGAEESKRGVLIGFFVLIVFSTIMYLVVLLEPSAVDINNDAMQTIFTKTFRIAIASLISYLCAQYLDIFIYTKIKKYTNSKHLWLRNNVAGISAQLLDSVLFVILAFYGEYPLEAMYSIIATTIIFKVAISMLNTPILYIGRYILVKQKLTSGLLMAKTDDSNYAY
jgi:uncharacterized integral membrane protein (TIGR00697 family)